MAVCSERSERNEKRSVTWVSLAVVGDHFLDSCLERDFDGHGYCGTHEVFLVVIDGVAG